MLQTAMVFLAMFGFAANAKNQPPLDREIIAAMPPILGKPGEKVTRDDISIVKNFMNLRLQFVTDLAGVQRLLVETHWECVVYYTDTVEGANGTMKSNRVFATYIDKQIQHK